MSEEVEVTRKESGFELKSISITAIKYDKPELLFDYLDLMMGTRFVKGEWLVPSKSEPDPGIQRGG